MLTRSHRGEIGECDPEIKKVCHMNNVEARRRKMVIDGEQERTLQDHRTPCVGLL